MATPNEQSPCYLRACGSAVAAIVAPACEKPLHRTFRVLRKPGLDYPGWAILRGGAENFLATSARRCPFESARGVRGIGTGPRSARGRRRLRRLQAIPPIRLLRARRSSLL